MAEMTFTVPVRWDRCYQCNRYYGYETGTIGYLECPFCARDRRQDAYAARDRALLRLAAMKGVVTRLKRREGASHA